MFFQIAAYGDSAPTPIFPPVGSNIAAQALLQNRFENLILGLGVKTWKERKEVGEKILSLLRENPHALRFFLFATRKAKEPEIRFQGLKVLKLYFDRNVYDPKRKMGFIGISLAVGGYYVFEGISYVPIRVVFPKNGFPGEKAGIKACDLILTVDGKKCSRNFSVEEFVDYISSKSPGDEVTLTILSHGQKVERRVVLTARPEDDGTPSVRKTKDELFDAWLKTIEKPRAHGKL